MEKNEENPLIDEVPSSENDEITLESEPESKRPRSLLYIIGCFVVLVLIGGLTWWLYSRQFVKTDDAFVEGNITLISSKLSSQITKIYVTENKYVRKGDLIIELDSQEPENKLAQAKANLQTSLANKTKARSNVLLTGVTGRAKIFQAQSNLTTSKNGIEQNRLLSSSKKNDIEQVRLQTTTAEAGLRQTQTQIKVAAAEIDKAKAQLKAAQNKYEIAGIELTRSKKLFESGVISKQALDQSNREMSEAEANFISAQKEVEITQTRYETAKRQIDTETARLNETKNRVASAENDFQQSLEQVDLSASQADESAGRLKEANSLPTQITVGSSEVEIAEAQVTQAEAAVAQAETELGYTKIHAPQDGYISRKAVQEGQIVQPGQSLLTITQGDIWIIANFKETQIENIKVGQAVDIYIDAYSATAFHGRIDSFQAGTGSRFSVLPSDKADGNFVKVVQRIPVKITFDEKPDDKYLLVPGMSVTPRVHIR